VFYIRNVAKEVMFNSHPKPKLNNEIKKPSGNDAVTYLTCDPKGTLDTSRRKNTNTYEQVPSITIIISQKSKLLLMSWKDTSQFFVSCVLFIQHLTKFLVILTELLSFEAERQKFNMCKHNIRICYQYCKN